MSLDGIFAFRTREHGILDVFRENVDGLVHFLQYLLNVDDLRRRGDGCSFLETDILENKFDFQTSNSSSLNITTWIQSRV